jgi:hypothetical protein
MLGTAGVLDLVDFGASSLVLCEKTLAEGAAMNTSNKRILIDRFIKLLTTYGTEIDTM